MRPITFTSAIIFCLGCIGSANADLTEFDAKRLIDNGCSELRAKANFTISPKCNFRVIGLKLHQSTDGPAADISVFSDGFLYNINFIARYKLAPSGNHTLIDVFKTN